MSSLLSIVFVLVINEIRKIARDNELQVANKPDSQDICFVPDGNYKKFLLEQYKKLGLSEEVIAFGEKIEAELKPRFNSIIYP